MPPPSWLKKIFARDTALFLRVNALVGRSTLLDSFGVICGRWLLWLMFAETFLMAQYFSRQPSLLAHEHAVNLATAGARGTVAAVIAFLGNWIFSRFAFRPRPFVRLRDEKRLAPPPLTSQSFPSSHSSAGFALAFSLCIIDPVFGGPMLVAATLVALGRVYVGVHYPLDVFVGMFVGLFWAVVLQWFGLEVGDAGIVRGIMGL